MNPKWLAAAALIILSVAILSIFRTCHKETSLPPVAVAVKRLSNPEDDAETRAAMLSIQNQGAQALDQVRALYNSVAPPPRAAEGRAEESAKPAAATPEEAPKAVRRAVAVNLLTSLPATPSVVGAIVEALGRETHPALQASLVDYLREAAGMQFNDRPADESVPDIGNDPAAWQRWWEEKGRSMTSFHAPYGTQPAGTPPPSTP